MYCIILFYYFQKSYLTVKYSYIINTLYLPPEGEFTDHDTNNAKL